MKKISLFVILVGMMIVSSCSSVKVTDSWKADNIGDIKNENILVVARADSDVGRQQFEQAIASELRAKGYKATESFSKFPGTNHKKKRTEAEIDELVSIIRAEGFDAIVLTVLRDKNKEIVTSETGGYTTGGYYPSAYGGYYGGFGGYYGSVYSPYGYGYGGSYVPSETRTYTSETYSVETVVYDLRKEKGKQLLGVTNVEITDPKSAGKVAPDYGKQVAKSFD